MALSPRCYPHIAKNITKYLGEGKYQQSVVCCGSRLEALKIHPTLEMDQEPLLSSTNSTSAKAIEGVVDHRGRPVFHSTSGGWTSAFFIIGVEMAERFAYYGVSTNLITYLTDQLGETTAAAAANVNTWSGMSSILPLPLGFIADYWLGRYRTIIIASVLYVLGLGMLTFSAVSPTFRLPNCSKEAPCSPSSLQTAFFFFSIYTVSFAQGGHKPCVQAFGADQFDENDPGECRSKGSFFNWWYFGLCFATVFTVTCLVYIQDNVGWGLGFGIPCISMTLALIIFLLGTKIYRFNVSTNNSPFAIISKAVERSNRRLRTSENKRSSHSDESTAVIVEDNPQEEEEQRYSTDYESRNCSGKREESIKSIMKLFPIWATCLIYAVVFSQSPTFFTKQGSTMDGRIGPTFRVPPAALQSFICASIVIVIPIYDRILVPVARKISGTPTGIKMLQRIGTGMFVSVISMVVAALVEIKRLQTIRDYGLIDSPETMIPMSLWWLTPQYILFGIADVFTMVGLQEFFYDQVPDSFRSLGLALYLSIFGIGGFISSALVSVIDNVTRKDGGDSWFSDNLNRAHLDYFYWLLAGLSAAQLLLYVYFSQSYVYKRKGGANP